MIKRKKECGISEIFYASPEDFEIHIPSGNNIRESLNTASAVKKIFYKLKHSKHKSHLRRKKKVAKKK